MDWCISGFRATSDRQWSCVKVVQNPAGTAPRGNISLADGYKQEWCSISWSSSTRWSHLISNVCVCVCGCHYSPCRGINNQCRQCLTASLHPPTLTRTPACRLLTDGKLITPAVNHRPQMPPWPHVYYFFSHIRSACVCGVTVTHLGRALCLWWRARWVRSRRTRRLTWWWSGRTELPLVLSI